MGQDNANNEWDPGVLDEMAAAGAASASAAGAASASAAVPAAAASDSAAHNLLGSIQLAAGDGGLGEEQQAGAEVHIASPYKCTVCPPQAPRRSAALLLL